MKTNEAKNILVVGAPGTGKSTVLGIYLKNLPLKEPFLLISSFSDPVILHQLRQKKVKEKNRVVVKKVSQATLWEVPRWIRENDRLYLIVTDLLDKEIQELEDDVSRVRDCTVVIDESRYFLHGQALSENMIRFFRVARHVGVETLVSTQRLVDIDPDIRATFTDLLLFHISSFRDLSVLADELPRKGLVEKLQNLPALNYLYIDKQHGIISENIIQVG